MPNLYAIPAGVSFADAVASHMLQAQAGEGLSRAVLLVPNRRSCAIMRRAFIRQLSGKASLLPRIFPLGESEDILLSLYGERALPIIGDIPPAMHESEHRYALARMIMAFEESLLRGGSLEYALKLADRLMALQESVIRHGVVLNTANLLALAEGDLSHHWQQTMQFLAILTESWPQWEAECGVITRAEREVRMTEALGELWKQSTPDYPVYVAGSTASQPATARLLKHIAELPDGHVILPGLDVTLPTEVWDALDEGNPLFHIRQFLNLWPMRLEAVQPLQAASRSVWLEALAPAACLQNWRNDSSSPVKHKSLSLIPCATPEEEGRVIGLLVREALESPTARVAVISPDEALLSRVASHLQCYGVMADQLQKGTLATTVIGSLWLAGLEAITSGLSPLTLRSFLHHPLLQIDAGLLAGLEAGWHGVNRTRVGKLPAASSATREHSQFTTVEQLVGQLHRLSSLRRNATGWMEVLDGLLVPWLKEAGQGADAVEDALATLRYADDFELLRCNEFAALLRERFSQPWRDAGIHTHPQVALLTPVEARMESFDRVVLANMQDHIWPRMEPPSPWLNHAAKQSLGLPLPVEEVSRAAHDVLMLASSGQVFLTYPLRDGGSPTIRSRFIDRLVALFEMRGVSEQALIAQRYGQWAKSLYASEVYAPELPVQPRPAAAFMPRKLAVTDLDKLFENPFLIYAKYILRLKPLDAIDASPSGSDFGRIAHKAAERLTQHWNTHHIAAEEGVLHAIAAQVLQDYSDRPNIDLFWRQRLLNGLRFINHLEVARRAQLRRVLPEQTIEGDVAGVTLFGRMDRLEEYGNGQCVVDYKTGEIPSEARILKGKELQLLAYYLLLSLRGEQVRGIEYWELPKIADGGDVLALEIEVHRGTFEQIEEKLKAALAQMLSGELVFIDTGEGEQAHRAYAGLSRYDEWAS